MRGKMKQGKEDGTGTHARATFINVPTKIIEEKRRKELNTFTDLTSAGQSFWLMSAEHFLYYWE